MARIKRVTREKEWTRKDDDDDDDRATRIEEDGGEKGEVVTRSRGIVNCEACTARLLVTVTVHLHSDLLNNVGIILRGKKKEVQAYIGRPRGTTSVDVFTRLLVHARLSLDSWKKFMSNISTREK